MNQVTINLGCANDWDKDKNDLYKKLWMNKTKVSTRNLGKCYNEYTFVSKLDDQEVTVVYTVDSSD